MSKPKAPPIVYLLIRASADPAADVIVWLVQRDGAAHSAFLWGTMPGYRADELAAWAESKGIEVERAGRGVG